MVPQNRDLKPLGRDRSCDLLCDFKYPASSPGKVTQSHVLTAMGVDPRLAGAAIRVSFGWNTKEQDLAAFADAWTRIVKRAEARAAA